MQMCGKSLEWKGFKSLSAVRAMDHLRAPLSRAWEFLEGQSFICQANNGGYRRNPDFPRHNRSGYSRNRNRLNEEKDSSENLDESEFLSTKNGPLLSLSNSPKSQATATPGPREREIVELFKKVQAQLRQRAVVKEEKKLEAVKGQNKESETVDSLLKLLRKHSVEQGKRKVNGGGANDFNFDHPRQSGQSNEEKSKSFFSSSSIVREEPQETNKPSFTRPPSEFRRRSPVPRIKYEPIVSHSDLDAELLDAEEDFIDEEDAEKEHTEDLNAMKLTELRALAKSRGMKGFSKLKKSELVGLLSDDSM
uniref:Rho termination factor-like N-terminal domain-containing protein n=1 Tax=Chenopodium quinoa TaxID=63459 RepID=A0A803LF88_CHEQI